MVLFRIVSVAGFLVGVNSFVPTGRFGLTQTRTLSPSIPKATRIEDDETFMAFYTLGTNFAEQVRQVIGDDLFDADEKEVLMDGFCKYFSDTDNGLSQEALEPFIPKIGEIVTERRKLNAAQAKIEGEAFQEKFLKENDDAVKTESGLIYVIQEEGEGERPTDVDTVEVTYQSQLPDGRVVDEAECLEFELADVIVGWREGIKHIKEGGKAVMVIPCELAYGDAGNDTIPPGATLKFDVELVKVTPPRQDEPDLLEMDDDEAIQDIMKQITDQNPGVKVRLVDPDDEDVGEA